MPSFTMVSFTQGRAHSVDAQVSRHFERGGAHKTFIRSVHRSRRLTSGHQLN